MRPGVQRRGFETLRRLQRLRRHRLAQLRFQLQIQLVEQLILVVEVPEQRALGDTGELRDLRSRRAHALDRNHPGGGLENGVPFVFTAGSSHTYTSIFLATSTTLRDGRWNR